MSPLVTWMVLGAVLIVVLGVARLLNQALFSITKRGPVDHSWLIKEHEEARLKALTHPHLFKGYRMPEDKQ